MQNAAVDEAAASDDSHFIGHGQNKLWLSTDGTTWTQVKTLTAQETFNINGTRMAVGFVLK
jgi:hypothetical protein